MFPRDRRRHRKDKASLGPAWNDENKNSREACGDRLRAGKSRLDLEGALKFDAIGLSRRWTAGLR